MHWAQSTTKDYIRAENKLVYLLVIHSTSHYTTSLFFSDYNSNYIHNFETQTRKNNNTCFGAYFYSAGTKHGNLHQLSNYEQCDQFYSAGLHRNRWYPRLTQEKKPGQAPEKNAGEWTRRVETSKEEIPGSRRSMHGYIRTCSRLTSGEPLSSGFSTDGSLISASAAPHCGGGFSGGFMEWNTAERAIKTEIDTRTECFLKIKKGVCKLGWFMSLT